MRHGTQACDHTSVIGARDREQDPAPGHRGSAPDSAREGNEIERPQAAPGANDPTTRPATRIDRKGEKRLSDQTLLVGLAHPDDEVGAAGTILAQREHGSRVVIVWLTRGEMTEAFGPIPTQEVAQRRMEQGRRAGEILGAETRFLDFPDTRLEATREAAVRVARLICEIRPTGLLTWGDGWTRGMRHPDHQACGRIFREAVTLARIAKVVAPLEPHRANVPIFTLRDVHSSLPAVAVDVEKHLARIHEVAGLYLQGVGFGDPDWLEHRLSQTGTRWGFEYAEEFDAWESLPGAVPALLPAPEIVGLMHPERRPAQR
jgi:N-acetylglucosamine malate deacetylase 1